jgi:predicted  nucleic acid-binding Zn-ribbon protein
LAGSEKAASDEDRRKEGSYINKSLLTLGTVISKLTESNGRSPGHIPFRDSKLTRILQTALSGLAKVAVICTISPALTSIEESLNTLKFASRVKRITIHAKNDAVMDDKALIQKYRNEIVELKSKLEATSQVLQREKEQTQSAIMAERRDHDQQMRQMRNVRNTMKERIDHLTRLILTSSSLVMNDSTTALLAATNDDHSNLAPLPSPPTSEHRLSLASNEVEELRKQLQKVTRESKEKDQQILALQEQLNIQTAKAAELETALSITKAELEVTQILAKEENEKKDRIIFSQHKEQLLSN